MPESQRSKRLEDPDDPGIAGTTTVRMLGSLAYLVVLVNMANGWVMGTRCVRPDQSEGSEK
jgi:hypothetical protein